MRLGELALRTHSSAAKSASSDEEYLQLSQAFSDFSACSSDISGESQRLASLPSPENGPTSESAEAAPEPEPCQGFLQRENFSTKIIESISPEDLQPTVKICHEAICCYQDQAVSEEPGRQSRLDWRVWRRPCSNSSAAVQ
ncbi:hypothetical protein C1H46_023665 [Malus baccata]|uniref:Uncharacterized protein n=1 Tax=Malus baccata TaxID=106549 RepID=A0A540LWF4_MALBA|nr:hypothetical protein C1H46_023665 [Malus baccata]